MELKAALRERMRSIPDFPKPGILFKDITPVLQDPPLLARCIGDITRAFADPGFDAVGGIEARGFILGALVAHSAGKPFFPLRKAGKLPGKCLRESYSLEYGVAELEMHHDAFLPGQRVIIVDDLLATGGTAQAAARLVQRSEGVLVGMAFLIELAFLDGRAKLVDAGVDENRIHSLVAYAAGE
ncbi:MAG: adenine phosphoribosyltransferase [Candidatus Eisenbacteria sp.]|nr:adenine phosphoribosyltransferase [Candidatus Eisenbacteria bacterium]